MKLALAVIAFTAVFTAFAEDPLRISLAQAASRRKADFGPTYEGRQVTVKGQVSDRPVRFYTAKYALMGIQDGQHGLILEGPEDRFDKLLPGYWVEVTGMLASRAGMPVLLPSIISVVDKAAQPQPALTSAIEVRRFDTLGRLVTAEFKVTHVGENAGGIYLNVEPTEDPLKIYAPLPAANVQWRFAGIQPGDRVRVTGLASQYCPVPPHNRRFEILVHSPSDVVRVDGGWILPPWALAVIGGSALCTTLLLWQREGRHRRQREMLRNVYELGEEILSSATLTDILKSVYGTLPRVFRVTAVRLYVHNRNAKTLDPVSAGEQPAGPSIPIDALRKSIDAAVVSAFRNQTLLAIPDTARSPFAAEPGSREKPPRAMLLIPMFAQGEAIGVLELAHDSATHNFISVERLAAQHLANQIGVAIKLLEQRSIREQLFRTEKVAAVGRLISGVVNELQAPLSSIASLTERALSSTDRSDLVLQEIQAESVRASAIVSRLVSFERPEQVDARPLDLNRLLRSFIEFRALEWKARGIHVRNFLRDGPLWVVGSQGQLEQVFLSLVVYAEQALADSAEKVISLGSNLMARRVLVELAFSAADQQPEDPFMATNAQAGTLNLAVCRSIIEGHEGEIRLTRARELEWRFEIELPWSPRDVEMQSSARPARDSSRQLTALIMETDEHMVRQLSKLLGARAYRVVPVRSAEEGLDLAQRLPFDVAFCSARLPGPNWIELLDRMRTRVGAFVLLTDGFDPQSAANAREEGYFVLSKPLEENQLDRILDHLFDVEASRRGVISA